MSHEDLTRQQEVERSSDRSFGFVFAGVFLLVAGWPLWYGAAPRGWALGAAAACAAIAALRPALLAGPNRAWSRLGVLLGRIVSPIALGVLFYVVLVPIGVAMRIAGKDPLRLRRDGSAASYWIPRRPPGPPPDSMTNQF